jgi:hypothetical protein
MLDNLAFVVSVLGISLFPVKSFTLHSGIITHR